MILRLRLLHLGSPPPLTRAPPLRHPNRQRKAGPSPRHLLLGVESPLNHPDQSEENRPRRTRSGRLCPLYDSPPHPCGFADLLLLLQTPRNLSFLSPGKGRKKAPQRVLQSHLAQDPANL